MNPEQNKIVQFWNQNYRAVIFIICVFIWCSPPLLGLTGSVSRDATIARYAETSFNAINSLKPGQIVFVSAETAGEAWGLMAPMARDISYHLMLKPGIKIIFASMQSRDGAILTLKKVLEYPLIVQAAKTGNKVYGRDYVQYPYYTGAIEAVSLFCDDIRAICTTDVFGTPTDEIPMMQNIYNVKNISLVWAVGPSPGLIEVWYARYRIPIIYSYGQHTMSGAAQYIRTGQYTGGVFGIPGAAQYELLLQANGYGLGTGIAIKELFFTDVMTCFIIGLIIFGNIVFFYGKYRARRK